MKTFLLVSWFILCAFLYWLCAQTALNLYSMPALGKFYFAIVPGILLCVMIASHILPELPEQEDENKKKKPFIPWTVIFLLAVLPFTAGNWYKLATDDGWHGWPSESRCGVCEERIWTWQTYDRRTYGVELEKEGSSSTIIDVQVGLSGLCHTACEGAPTEKVKLRIE